MNAQEEAAIEAQGYARRTVDATRGPAAKGAEALLSRAALRRLFAERMRWRPLSEYDGQTPILVLNPGGFVASRAKPTAEAVAWMPYPNPPEF